MSHKEESKRIETIADIDTYLVKLKYAINVETTKLQLVMDRSIDENRVSKYTNRYTISSLFPNEDPVEALKRELQLLTVAEYIETVKDLRFPKKSEMRVFGKIYSGEDVYIKIRVELLSLEHACGDNFILVMSFHFAERGFNKTDFPYLNR